MARHWNMAINRFCTTAMWSISPMTGSPITGAAAPVSGCPRMPARVMSRTGTATSRLIATGTNTTGTRIKPIATRAGPGFRPDRTIVRRLHPMSVPLPRVIAIAMAIRQGQPAGRAPIGRTAPVQSAAPGHPRIDVALPLPTGTATAISPDQRRVAAVRGKTARIQSAIAGRRRILASLFRARGITTSIQADPSVVRTRSGMDDSDRTTVQWKGVILGLRPFRHAPIFKTAAGQRRDRSAHRRATPGGLEARTCAVPNRDGHAERKAVSGRIHPQVQGYEMDRTIRMSVLPPCVPPASARDQTRAAPSPPIRAYAVRRARPDGKSMFASPAD